MKDLKDIQCESDIEVKEEVDNDVIECNESTDIQIESNEFKSPQIKTYCLLCQEYGHVINDDCVVNATCFSCGVKGHIRRDCYCLLCQEHGHVLNDDCTTCFSCGVGGHVRRDCPYLLDKHSLITDPEQQQPLSIQTQTKDFSGSSNHFSLRNSTCEFLRQKILHVGEREKNKLEVGEWESITECDRGRDRDREKRLYNKSPQTEKPCKFFLRGGCKFGTTCRFMHDNEKRRGLARPRERSREGLFEGSVQKDDSVESIAGSTDVATEKVCLEAKGSPANATTEEVRTGVNAYNAEQRQAIIREVVVDLIAPGYLTRKYKISAHSIRNLVKKTGQKLPTQYKKSEWSYQPPKEHTDATTKKALVVTKAERCQGQGGSDRIEDGRTSNQTDGGQSAPPSQDPKDCQVSDKSFMSHRTLDKHMKKQHGIAYNAEQSYRTNGGETIALAKVPQECKVCDKSFRSHRTLDNHMKKQHGIAYMKCW